MRIVHGLANAVEADQVDVGSSQVHRIGQDVRKAQLCADVVAMILLQHVGPHANEAQAEFVDHARAKHARPFESGVLAVVQCEAAVTRQ